MDWTISMGDEPGVTVFNRDGIFIAVTAMLIGAGVKPEVAKVTAENAREEARKYQQDQMLLRTEGLKEHRIDLLDGQFVLLKSLY